MNYPKIYKSKEILDIVISQINREVDNKDVFEYVNRFQLKLVAKYLDIYEKLPNYSKMNDYYLLMSKNIVPENTMEKYRNHYLSSMRIINQISEKYKQNILKQKKLSIKNKLKKEYIGRISSVIKKLEKTNEKLLNLKKDFKRIPNPKELFTIVLIGLPNSGKTTLLTQITDANPEINSYSFTTKSLNLGYFKIRERVIQVVDTPGLIHLDFTKMNIIEKQAIVAIKTIGDVVVFLYNQYQNLKSQEDMLEKIKEENQDKKIIVYPSFGGKMPNYKNITLDDILKLNF